MSGKGKNDELIDHIANRLRNHAEPYREGAWERFAAQAEGRRRRGMAWSRWAAAAILVLAAGWFVFDLTDNERGNGARQVFKQQSAGQQLAVEERPDEDTAPVSPYKAQQVDSGETPDPVFDQSQTVRTALAVRSGQVVENREASATAKSAAPHMVASASASHSTDASTAGGAPIGRDASVGRDVEEIVGEQPIAADPMPAQPENHSRLAYESQGIHESVSEEAGKWDFAIALAPSVTSERLNLGGGVAVAYRLSDKISLASGVSLSDLGVAQQHTGQPSALKASLTPNSPAPGQESEIAHYRNREITSVSSTLLAVDIPLNLRYHVTDRFYTSAGVSFIGILKERRINHFVDHINQPTTDYAYNLKAVHSAERSGEQPLQGRGYTGFLNFSVGRSVPLSRKVFLAVEPYFKLPIGRLSNEDMDLTNGGVRIVTGF